MSREINFDEIILKETDFITKRNESVYNVNDLKRCMKEACRQTLKLAASNAKLLSLYYRKDEDYDKYCEFAGTFPERCDGDGVPYAVDVFDIDKKSILDTISQIK